MQSGKHELCWSHCLLACNGLQKCSSNEKLVGVGVHATHACNKRGMTWNNESSVGNQVEASFLKISKKPGLSKARASLINSFSMKDKEPPLMKDVF